MIYTVTLSDLGPGRIAARRIPCACIPCTEQLARPWLWERQPKDQPRYAINEDCELWSVFEGLNNYHILELQEKKESDNDEFLQAQKLVVDSWANSIAPCIHAETIGAQNSVDGYYLVQFTGEPRRVEEDTVLEKYTPPIYVGAGELVVEGRYFSEVPRAKRWFTSTTDSTVMRVSQILLVGLSLLAESELGPTLPSGCNRRQAREKGARLLTAVDHGRLLDEIQRRQVVDFVEETDDIMEVSDDDASIQSENESECDDE
jgi:hypothetical protein